MLVASSVASMDPVAVWIAHLRGLPVPSPITTVLLFYPTMSAPFWRSFPPGWCVDSADRFKRPGRLAATSRFPEVLDVLRVLPEWLVSEMFLPYLRS
jgi:hypothetical protein